MFIYKIKVVTWLKFLSNSYTYIKKYECVNFLIIEINKKVIILLVRLNLLGVLFKFI